MKIRIKGNSIRLRLTKTEVETFGATGRFSESTQMLGGELRYALLKSNIHDTLAAEWKDGWVEVYMPEALANEWVNSDEVGFQHIFPLPQGGELFLLIEKDFVCLDNTFEDQSDNYPNPNAVC
ncbi:MAG: hypothetical protein RL577_9 [Bacteroidota bacterium]|jgi:hypothetical protein